MIAVVDPSHVSVLSSAAWPLYAQALSRDLGVAVTATCVRVPRLANASASSSAASLGLARGRPPVKWSWLEPAAGGAAGVWTEYTRDLAQVLEAAYTQRAAARSVELTLASAKHPAGAKYKVPLAHSRCAARARCAE